MTEHGPSAHLRWAELACHDAARTPYPLSWRETRGFLLAVVFEAIRTACCDKPIRVVSGYRTPAHNLAVQGAPKSQHCQGRAMDLHPPIGLTVLELHRRIVVLALMSVPQIRGLGLYDNFVHVDIRPTVELAAWDLRTVKAVNV